MYQVQGCHLQTGQQARDLQAGACRFWGAADVGHAQSAVWPPIEGHKAQHFRDRYHRLSPPPSPPPTHTHTHTHRAACHI